MKRIHFIYITIILVMIVSFLIYSGNFIINFGVKKDAEKPKSIKKKEVIKGPKFNIEDLLDIYSKNASQFENYVLEKGYKLFHSENQGDNVVHFYKYLKDENIDGTRYNLSLTFPKLGQDGEKRIDWFFVNQNTDNSIDTIYLNIKKDVEQSDFKCWNTSSVNGLTNYSYVKGTIFIDFNQVKTGNPEIQMYGVSISEIPKIK